MRAAAVAVALGVAFTAPAAAAATPQVLRFDGGAYDRAGAITSDGAGNSYLAGSAESRVGASPFAVVKLGPDGTTRWAQRYNGPGNYDDFASQVVVDGAGNAIVTGYSYGQDYDWATLKFAPDGARLWERR